MTIPMNVNYYLGYNWENFVIGSIITSLSGTSAFLFGKLSKPQGTAIFIITSSSWSILSIFAAIPFYFDNLSYIDSLFEAISGITTTGATILSDIESKSPGILLWRAILHSIGGFGIIAAGIAIFPSFKTLGLNNLLYSEYSDALKQRLPNIRSVVINITLIYYGLIFFCIFFYYMAGMSFFDSICHGMSTVSTGGFANYNDAIGHYNSAKIEVITIIFMILGSLPFLSYLKIIKSFHIYYDEQISFFIRIIIFSSIFVCIWTYFNVSNVSQTLGFRRAIFTNVSIITSTGHTIYDYTQWSFVSILTFFLSFIGGCGGSASGGIKVFRIIILIKLIKNYIYTILKEEKNLEISINNKILMDKDIRSVYMFFLIYIMTFAVSSVIMCYISKSDFLTSISSVSAMLTNLGPGFSKFIGPDGNYSIFSDLAKLFLSFLMILGRLEILPIYICFFSLFSKKIKEI
ncbi:TrkH family potassium uptake protein [Wolbachia endosymbiont of Pentidionis agamae]|uniref:TrkH family potassium uptake protein n=1 Tax=Wolbachia endosymbiont of Pentidionis agamae TaxID=3110435 RepID=UPI002FD48B7C